MNDTILLYQDNRTTGSVGCRVLDEQPGAEIYSICPVAEGNEELASSFLIVSHALCCAFL